ncbi:MAG: hypothetical protein M3410_04925 [Acidobacteriota bacterium]|nr:hypothetical protein [Acidobacteriota bacterium]
MHTKRRTLLIVLPLLVVGTGIGTAALRALSQEKQLGNQEAAITEKQREHSRLYKEYNTGKRISELVAEMGDVRIRRNSPLSGGDPTGFSADPHEFLRGLVCDADAVLIGKVKDKSSHMSEDESFVYTDYEMSVTKVLKDNSAAHIEADADISITRPGGVIRVNGRTVEAIDNSFAPLTVKGHYLVFLRFMPVTATYRALGSQGSFELRGKEINKLTKESLPLDNVATSKNVDSFVNEIHIALASGCSKGNTQ